jgi:hypothetical protein
MIDDILADLFGEMAFGRLNNTKRVQLIARLFFGLLAPLRYGITLIRRLYANPAEATLIMGTTFE